MRSWLMYILTQAAQTGGWEVVGTCSPEAVGKQTPVPVQDVNLYTLHQPTILVLGTAPILTIMIDMHLHSLVKVYTCSCKVRVIIYYTLFLTDKMYVCCVALPCCLFDLACLFLPSASLIHDMYRQ